MADPMRAEDLRPTADVSDCGRYRYNLVRHLTAKRTRLRICWVMLNPSTADVTQDDPTIRRVLGFSADWGFDELEVVNLFAWRATCPDELAVLRSPSPVGPENDRAIQRAMERSHRIVAAWGAWGPDEFIAPRQEFVTELVRRDGWSLACLGLTKHGRPRHPLMVARGTALTPYPPCADRPSGAGESEDG